MLKYLTDNLTILTKAEAAERAAASLKTSTLVQLYCTGIISPDMQDVFNVFVSKLEHVCEDNETPEYGFQRTFDVLCERILVVEERPVVTRFFLFISCVNTYCQIYGCRCMVSDHRWTIPRDCIGPVIFSFPPLHRRI